jgi:4-hydroxy-tetrahydrodipicolinate synthase
MKEMIASSRLHGVVVAVPTPLMEDETLDTDSFKSLIDYCVDQGADGVMILGAMGEGAALTDDVRSEAMDVATGHIRGRIPLLVTVSGASTKRTIAYAQEAAGLRPDYLVCTSPFYYKFPDPDSLVGHVQRVSESTDIPLVYYNAPGSTGNPADANTIDRILQLPGVSGIKDSSCQFGIVSELLRRYPDPATRPGTIMQGDESVYDASLLMGADGVVTGGGVLFIPRLKSLYEAGKAKDIARAMEIQTAFTGELMEVLLPDLARNWMYRIKQRLVDRGVIAHATATAPFLTS